MCNNNYLIVDSSQYYCYTLFSMSHEETMRLKTPVITRPDNIYSHHHPQEMKGHPFFQSKEDIDKFTQTRDELGKYLEVLSKNYELPTYYERPYCTFFDYRWGTNFITAISPKEIATVLTREPLTEEQYQKSQKSALGDIYGSCFSVKRDEQTGEASYSNFIKEYQNLMTDSPKKNIETILRLIRQHGEKSGYKQDAVRTLCYLYGAKKSMEQNLQSGNTDWKYYRNFAEKASNILYGINPIYSDSYWNSKPVRDSEHTYRLLLVIEKAGVELPQRQKQFFLAMGRLFEIRAEDEFPLQTSQYKRKRNVQLKKLVEKQFGRLPFDSIRESEIGDIVEITLSRINQNLRQELINNLLQERGQQPEDIIKLVVKQYVPNLNTIEEDIVKLGVKK